MFGADRRAHRAEFFRKINTLPNTELYSYSFLIFVFKSLKGLGGANMYKVYWGTSNTRLNSQGGVPVPFARTKLYKKIIFVDAAVRWNSLPVFIRQLDN